MLVILGIILVLECMPGAIKMSFFAGPGETYDTYVPYYDLLPTGYATFFPMFMMTYTVILMVIYIINLFLPDAKFLGSYLGFFYHYFSFRDLCMKRFILNLERFSRILSSRLSCYFMYAGLLSSSLIGKEIII